jgi:hypothetical protein
MLLLSLDDDGSFSLTQFSKDKISPYAILSTPEEEERMMRSYVRILTTADHGWLDPFTWF